MEFIELVVYIMIFIICAPILVFIHEFGHIITPLLVEKGKVFIIIGDGNINKSINLKKLTIVFNGYKSIMSINSGYVKCSSSTKFRSLLIALGGPVTSLIIATILYHILKENSHQIEYLTVLVLNTMFKYSLIQFIMTAIPMKYNYHPYNGFISDGYRVLSILKDWKR